MDDADTWSWVSDFGAPAAVALVTTLVVEYFAKPWLDARKARMLRDRNQLDEVVFAFQKAAMLGGAVLPSERVDSDAARRVQLALLARLDLALSDLQDSLARLPSHFVVKHREHVARTTRFIGYAVAVSAVERDARSVDGSRVAAVTADISEFDAYFVANATLRDSQAPWYKRWFSRKLMKDEYARSADEALARHGLA